MSIARHHSEWLSLVEVSGPFLSLPVLMRAFPQGLEDIDPAMAQQLRIAYAEWQDDLEHRTRAAATHREWIGYVLRRILEFPEEAIAEGQAISDSLKATVPEHRETLRPTHVIRDPADSKPHLLVVAYPPQQALDKKVSGRHWVASPETRMTELLHASGMRLGLVTNGEHWLLVDSPRDDTAGFASWYAELWIEERLTLRAFRSLIGFRRFFGVAATDTLEVLLAESAESQQEVTDQLGYQVRRAVEVLVQALDQSDQDHGRQLLASVPEAEIYEAALTVMMRLVFLFCAEERDLLLLGDPLFDQHYAVSPLRGQLRQAADLHGEEVLERRHDAWCRLLATFRAVHGGVRHERMTIPPYGGTLFDPDRFPFLEGRRRGTTWRTSTADPLPVSNRTVLHLLEALQLLQVKVPGGGPAEARRLSFRALDIEQIGHVYEGLLDHTAKRATAVTLGLAGARAKTRDYEPEVPLSTLEALAAKGRSALVEYLIEGTHRSAKAIEKALDRGPDPENEQKLRVGCGSVKDAEALFQRIRPFGALIRTDSFGHPVIINTGSVYVTEGIDRRSTGTQYTPRSLTEPIVQHTLEPLVYEGPGEGKSRELWRLRSACELLALAICDFTCGSGAFIVQACRYLADRLLEAWEEVERQNPGALHITPEGEVSQGLPEERLIPKDPDERITFARRLVAQRCLYGVDVNPLAVEMTKLSMWLLTLAKEKPFTFLDHAIRCGDSLVGITGIEQLKRFSLAEGPVQTTIAQAESFDAHIDDAIAKRLRLETMEGSTVDHVEAQKYLLGEAERGLARLKAAADQLIAAEVGDTARDDAIRTANNILGERDAPWLQGPRHRRAFHWSLEFPEVIEGRGGFDALLGNPPFRGGLMITRDLGSAYTRFLKDTTSHAGATTDLCAYFFRRAFHLLRSGGCLGLIATNSIREGDTRVTSLDTIVNEGGVIFRAIRSMPWPGAAALHVSRLHISSGLWAGIRHLDGVEVDNIGPDLASGRDTVRPSRLQRIVPAFLGTTVYGNGFFLSLEEARTLISSDPRNAYVLRRFLNGDDVLNSPAPQPMRYVLYFQGMEENDVSRYELPYSIAKERVFSERQKSSSARRREKWWLYTSPADALYETIKGLSHVLVTCFTSKYVLFAAMDTNMVFSNAVIVVASDDNACLAVLQSSLHESWVREYSSTLETRQRYALSDCYETFPMPIFSASLRAVGKAYSCHRSRVMSSLGEGLTDIYNRFHDPKETSAEIKEFRTLHAAMDHAVVRAYGWQGLSLGEDFHETKQGPRFTMSDSARREILDRLLQLNHERYADEVRLRLRDKAPGTKGVGRRRAQTKDSNLPSLFH
ncbi:MAG TPA: type IIL restriction-modification enzyme MmeI [Thermoanaerobaculia bacterium]|nr:type IIL restriction-modification enzyme MmeI [Thermoanaerobaculia bacterium]